MVLGVGGDPLHNLQPEDERLKLNSELLYTKNLITVLFKLVPGGDPKLQLDLQSAVRILRGAGTGVFYSLVLPAVAYMSGCSLF